MVEEKNAARLFVSVEVPEEIRRKVHALANELPQDAVRPVRPENMHLTLRFIGETPKSRIGEIRDALSRVRFSPFRCVIRGTGVFPNESYVRVVWAGVESPGLDALAKDVISALKGFGGDERFSAHLTIARVKGEMGAKQFLERHKNELFGEFMVESFRLMESRLSGGGPEYTAVRSFHGQG